MWSREPNFPRGHRTDFPADNDNMAILGGHRDSHDSKQKCGEFCDVNSDQTQGKNSSGEQTEQKKKCKVYHSFWWFVCHGFPRIFPRITLRANSSSSMSAQKRKKWWWHKLKDHKSTDRYFQWIAMQNSVRAILCNRTLWLQPISQPDFDQLQIASLKNVLPTFEIEMQKSAHTPRHHYRLALVRHIMCVCIFIVTLIVDRPWPYTLIMIIINE